MRIIQLTDLHISPLGVDTYGVDVRHNLEIIVSEIQKLKYDLLVISGDFCFKAPSLEIYRWIKNKIKELPGPMMAIGGNHDDIAMMIDGLQLTKKSIEGELYFKNLHQDIPILFLDSSKSVMSDGQFDWLETELNNCQGPLCIFTHYPPIKMGVPFMDDKHAFHSSSRLVNLLYQYSHPVHVFTGHYHVEKTWSYKNLNVYITPSCFFQINMLQTEFAIDHYRIGYRLIDWLEEGVFSSVHYIDP